MFLNLLPPVHQGNWGPVFTPLIQKLVPAVAELIIIDQQRVLLTYREDEHYRGWHTPGGYVGPGETWHEAASRIAMRELTCDVTHVEHVASFLQNDDPRLINLANVLVCRLTPESIPTTGEWFTEFPHDILPHQKKFWPIIEPHLKD